MMKGEHSLPYSFGGTMDINLLKKIDVNMLKQRWMNGDRQSVSNLLNNMHRQIYKTNLEMRKAGYEGASRNIAYFKYNTEEFSKTKGDLNKFVTGEEGWTEIHRIFNARKGILSERRFSVEGAKEFVNEMKDVIGDKSLTYNDIKDFLGNLDKLRSKGLMPDKNQMIYAPLIQRVYDLQTQGMGKEEISMAIEAELKRGSFSEEDVKESEDYESRWKGYSDYYF